jgi:hypothetical protein
MGAVMSFFNPSQSVRDSVKFYSEFLQAMAIITAGLWGAWTYHVQSNEQNERAKESAAAVERELQRPYNEKKLALYLEASRVSARLAATPKGPERSELEARFWELYWGELAFVESTGTAGSVEKLMVHVCHQLFKNEQCHTYSNSATGSVMLLSHIASREIKEAWHQELPFQINELVELAYISAEEEKVKKMGN